MSYRNGGIYIYLLKHQIRTMMIFVYSENCSASPAITTHIPLDLPDQVIGKIFPVLSHI